MSEFLENKIKSPVSVLKALGVYRKNNLLDEVLKLYKSSPESYPKIASPHQIFSNPLYNSKEGFDAFGNPIGNEKTSIVNPSKFLMK